MTEARFFSSPQRQTGSGATQPPIQWVLRANSPRVKRPGRESNQSSTTSARDKNGGATSPLSHMSLWYGVQLIEHRDNFAFFTFIFMNINIELSVNHHEITLSWTQFGFYELLKVYLHDQKLGLLSVNNETFITEFGFWRNLVFLIHVNIARKVRGFLVSYFTTLSISKLYSDEKRKV
jgi:hypothetical protein